MVERKLVTILSADVCRVQPPDGGRRGAEPSDIPGPYPDISRFGRFAPWGIFNTAVTPSWRSSPPIEAVRCATEIQAALRTRNEQFPLSVRSSSDRRQCRRRSWCRIPDLPGLTGVNVAARLQGGGAPGGILQSQAASMTRFANKITLGFEIAGRAPVQKISPTGADLHHCRDRRQWRIAAVRNAAGRYGIIGHRRGPGASHTCRGLLGLFGVRQNLQIKCLAKRIEKAPANSLAAEVPTIAPVPATPSERRRPPAAASHSDAIPLPSNFQRSADLMRERRTVQQQMQRWLWRLG